jgi:AraC-like DNA-binding protein
MMPGMPATTKKTLDPIEKFMGEDARIHSRESYIINNNIAVERAAITLSEDTIPEDEGKLYLFPIDDNRFCMQLCYLQYEDESLSNAVVTSLRFLPSFFDQYPPETLMANQPFRFDQVTEQQFPVCIQTRLLLNQLEKSEDIVPFIVMLQQNEAAIQLMRRALECVNIPCEVPACRFLAYESEREKIQDARALLNQHIDRLLTIRELSKKVAMNECYLKKGFKALVGKTIHEYQQELRITKAKELLQIQGQSVTDVANTLGYSSISHFSTAFKRVTGMKPCELLA